MDIKKTIQIRLPLDSAEWHGASSEGIWTFFVTSTAERAVVEIDNIPFFTKSLSLGDKISVVFGQAGLTFDAVVERGGHSTYRVFVENQGIEASNMLDTIKVMGCDWEKANFRGGELYALDIPPEVDIYEVYEILEKGSEQGTWLFEEGYVGHRLKDDPILPSS